MKVCQILSKKKQKKIGNVNEIKITILIIVYIYKYLTNSVFFSGDSIKRKYPDRRPVIAERYPDSNIRPAGSRKYLLPCDLTIGQFYFLLRKKMEMKPDQALYLFVKVCLLSRYHF